MSEGKPNPKVKNETNNPTKSKSGSFISRLILFMWISFASGLTLFVLFILSVEANFMNLYGEMPSLKSLENPHNDLASELYSADNVLLGKYFRENRSPVEYEDLSPNLVNALLATEDYRFQKHSGVDLRGLGRVFVFSILMGRETTGGGSTLTQQLAKLMFRTRTKKNEGKLSNIKGLRMLIIKTKEWIISVKLERSYTKKEILTMYLNTAEFGSNAFGIKVAAKSFFNKEPSELNLQEASLLVGMLQAPSRFNPHRNPKNATHRRNVVLSQMMKYKFITPEYFDSLKVLPIELEYNVENHNQGIATYFRSVIRNYLLEWADQHGYDLFESGLRIHTTIDSRLQQYAEEAVEEQMAKLQQQFDEHWKGKNPWIDSKGNELPGFLEANIKRTPYYRHLVAKHGRGHDSIMIELKKPKPMKVFSWKGEIDTVMSSMDSLRYFKRFLQTGFMAMEPNTGHIKAWVGGINHKYFKYDHVKQGKRQPGSAFKAFVYAAAIENGYSPCYEAVDLPVTFQVVGDPPTWTPQNANGKYSGETMTLRQAMAKSVNSITAYMMKKIGPQNVVDVARRMGVQSHLEAVPSLCLGVNDLSIYELVGAYSTFANEGLWNEPFFITRIEDKNGNILQQFVPKTIEALNEETAYLMLHMLTGATEFGTAVGIGVDLKTDNQIGGKTGTTQNGSDGWFMGVTKDLVGGAWVGGDDRSIRFRSWALGSGGRTAMPIWANFMRKVYADPNLPYTKGEFKKPEKLSIEINCDKYKNHFQDDLNDSIQYNHVELKPTDIF
jgi:penicillin-binding protein 1A